MIYMNNSVGLGVKDCDCRWFDSAGSISCKVFLHVFFICTHRACDTKASLTISALSAS